MIRSKPMSTQKGLTLVELMVAIAVAAILMTTVAPGFQTMILNSRISSQTNELVSALAFARSEAIRSGQSVSVCASNNDWQTGWSVARVNDCQNAPGNEIRIWDAPTVTVNSAMNSIRFDALGARESGDFLVIFHIDNNIDNRELSVNVNGSPRIELKHPIDSTAPGDTTNPDDIFPNPDDIFDNPDAFDIGEG